MHYEEYEWRLFCEGSLSTRMKKEMMDHLRTCDVCLSAYLTAMEPKVKTQNVIETKSAPARKRKYFYNQPRVLWRPVGVIAMALAVFALMLFTPQGKTAWAQIRASLQEIGITFLQRFGLEEDSPYVSKIEQPAVYDTEIPMLEGIEVKLDQVIVEAYNLSYSILVSGNLPEEVEHVRFFERIEIDGEMPLTLGGGTSYRLKDDPDVILYTMTYSSDINLFEKETHHVKITSNDMDMTGEAINRRISGPWVFEFDVNAKALAPDTRIIQLSEMITLRKTNYEIEQLEVSPVRQRFVVRKRFAGVKEGNSAAEISTSRGNLAGFLLGAESDVSIAFIYSGGNKDEQGVVLYYEPDQNQYELMSLTNTWHVTPYISEKTFTPNQTPFNGYTPMESASFDVYQTIPVQE